MKTSMCAPPHASVFYEKDYVCAAAHIIVFWKVDVYVTEHIICVLKNSVCWPPHTSISHNKVDVRLCAHILCFRKSWCVRPSFMKKSICAQPHTSIVSVKVKPKIFTCSGKICIFATARINRLWNSRCVRKPRTPLLSEKVDLCATSHLHFFYKSRNEHIHSFWKKLSVHNRTHPLFLKQSMCAPTAHIPIFWKSWYVHNRTPPYFL